MPIAFAAVWPGLFGGISMAPVITSSTGETFAPGSFSNRVIIRHSWISCRKPSRDSTYGCSDTA